MIRTLSVALVSCLAVLLLAGPAAAQGGRWGPGQQGPNWDRAQYNYQSRTYGGTVNTGVAVPAATTTQSFYNAPMVDNRSVLLQMRVPANARIFFGDTPTDRMGTVREFVSPPINPGQDYVYDIRVQWDDNGKPMEQNRRVTVHAGDRISLDFTRPTNESR